MKSRTVLSLLVLLLPICTAVAQPSDTITANPKAVLLRRVWTLQGKEEEQRVGYGAGDLGEIFGAATSARAIHIGALPEWRVYRDSGTTLADTAIWTFKLATPRPFHPVHGNFFGDSTIIVGLGQYLARETPERYLMYLFRAESGRLADTAFVKIDPLQTMTPPTTNFVTEAFAEDLDNSGTDELVLVSQVLVRNKQRSTKAEIWIYKGGADFQVDTPTVIVRDDEDNDDVAFSTALSDLDGDGYVDMVTGCAYHSGAKLKFYWGSATSPWSWSVPDRVIILGAGYPTVASLPKLLDADGDRVDDIILAGSYLYRSHTGKDFRTRSFRIDDADEVFLSSVYSGSANGGALNDSTRRFSMLLKLRYGAERFDGSAMLAFSGGINGPDSINDAYYRPEEDGLAASHVFGNITPMNDCTGDGWPDLLTANPQYGGYNQGIALVLSGGPNIPRDSMTSSVRQIQIEGRTNAVSIWPNPVSQELHIAWRGDLRKMPTRFVIHDMHGAEVAAGTVESWRGEALWHCEDVAAGEYLLTVYDGAGEAIATARVVKQ